MKTLEKGKDKIREICDVLRRETLEPAQGEAKLIVAEAEEQRSRILKQAQDEANVLLAAARAQIEKERQVYKSSLEQASKQALEALRQSIEQQLFQPELVETVDKRMVDPDVVAKLIRAIVTSLESEGLETDLHALIPRTVSADQINALLGKEILTKLKDHAVKVGDFAGGAQVKLLSKKMTIDISSQALVELLTRYLRDDFRQFFFKA